jgi:hypothetical protein
LSRRAPAARKTPLAPNPRSAAEITRYEKWCQVAIASMRMRTSSRESTATDIKKTAT